MKQRYMTQDHTFVICAYQKSRYLNECVQSIMKQELLGKVCIATSTPNDFIFSIAAMNDLPVYVNPKSEGIAADWNFALNCAKTPLVTLAHQDDIYEKEYLLQVLNALNQSSNPLLAFSDYCEVRGGKKINKSTLLAVKRVLLFPLRFSGLWKNRFVRRRILAFGNAICCPAVTLVKEELKLPVFTNNMKSNIDWQAWEEISRYNGDFVYVPQPLMGHRIHEESTTSGLLECNARRQEDIYMFQKFWPNWVAEIIDWFYRSNEKANQVK